MRYVLECFLLKSLQVAAEESSPMHRTCRKRHPIRLPVINCGIPWNDPDSLNTTRLPDYCRRSLAELRPKSPSVTKMSGRGAYYKALYGGGRSKRRQNGDSFGGGHPAFTEEADIFPSGGPPSRPRAGVSSLRSELQRLEGRPYPAYKDLIGEWQMEEFQIFIDKVQSDPFAPPSRFRLRLPQHHAQFPKHMFETEIRNIALCDFLTRAFHHAIQRSGIDQAAEGGGWHGSKGGDIRIDQPSQHILRRTSMIVTTDAVEARCHVSLPARGRSIEGRRAAQLLCERLPAVARAAMYFSRQKLTDLEAHIQSVEDQEYLRGSLAKHGLVAFVINGACLPRRSGVDDRPLTSQQDDHLVLFQSPPSLEVRIGLPNRGEVKGMGIPAGITLIVGGGFHGKSTLLEALQWGVYNKIPGDGREFVVTDPGAVKIRAEDGRAVTSVDISPFINNLPFGKSTGNFSSADASGSTSQAANIMEALELGATTLLVDEDTCATNFMIRDTRMQALVSKEKEPITPFIFKIRPLVNQYRISTIMVVGGSGDFFEVADHVIMMDNYQAYCVTEKAKEIAASHTTAVETQTAPNTTKTPGDTISDRFGVFRHRVLEPGCLNPKGKVKATARRAISYGSTDIDLTCIEQLAEASQTRAIARCLQRLGEKVDDNIVNGERTLKEILESMSNIMSSIKQPGIGLNGLDALADPWSPLGDLSLPRQLEIGFSINRLRTLRIRKMKINPSS
ncbi:putative ATPase [Toxoplasma gondii RUB]|uniref:Putative ATPase n=1 Tax=Toxoplasma gondii RUB TaxID=935652 RepID=A0A086LLP0_TOXGO|nr:putative ATPase [Toxoplasma gondii RUB]